MSHQLLAGSGEQVLVGKFSGVQALTCRSALWPDLREADQHHPASIAQY